MRISQKAQYGLRAVFELARRGDGRYVKIRQIAQAQAIPQRFLEGILAQLKRAGLVVAKRGSDGGYMLARGADSVSVGEVLRLMDDSVELIECFSEKRKGKCRLSGNCAFVTLWGDVQEAIRSVLDETTLWDLVSEYERVDADFVADYVI